MAEDGDADDMESASARVCPVALTGVPCYVADDPLSCVAVGTGLALEHMDILRDSLEEP